MTAIGPGTSNCERVKIADPQVDVVQSITLFTAEVITGVTISLFNKNSEQVREKSWGLTQVRDKTVVNFDYVNNPLIGIYGYQGRTLLNGLGFITYDLGKECQNYVEPPPIVEPVTDDSVDEEESDEDSEEDSSEPIIPDEMIKDPEEPFDIIDPQDPVNPLQPVDPDLSFESESENENPNNTESEE